MPPAIGGLHAGHPSTHVFVPAATRFESTSLPITYTPGVGARAATGLVPRGSHKEVERHHRGVQPLGGRACATFRFTGTSVSWIGFRAQWAGIAGGESLERHVRECRQRDRRRLYSGRGYRGIHVHRHHRGWIGFRRPLPGMADVFLNGSFVRMVDL
jgi:hypothetical protein